MFIYPSALSLSDDAVVSIKWKIYYEIYLFIFFIFLFSMKFITFLEKKYRHVCAWLEKEFQYFSIILSIMSFKWDIV